MSNESLIEFDGDTTNAFLSFVNSKGEFWMTIATDSKYFSFDIHGRMYRVSVDNIEKALQILSEM